MGQKRAFKGRFWGKIAMIFLAGSGFLLQGFFFSLAAENYALVLGVNYKGKSPIRDLNSPEKDAALIRQRLAQTGEFSSSRIQVLLGEKVNRAQIKKEINRLARIITSKDQFFLFFSGHGAYYRNTGSGDRSKMLHFLVMYYRPHLSGKELNAWLKKIKGSSLIVVDACYSGGLTRPGQNVKGASNIPIPEGSDAVILQNIKHLAMSGRVVITSSDADETSIEAGPPIAQGVFTYHFAKAMSEGDLNRDGSLTASEVFNQAKQNTVAMAKRFKHRQTPQISGDASNWYFTKSASSSSVSAGPGSGGPQNSLPESGSSSTADLPGPAGNVSTPDESATQSAPQAPPPGSITIGTNLRYEIIQNEPVVISLIDGNQEGQLLEADPFDWKVRWVKDSRWGKVAHISSKAPGGVYRISIKAKGYSSVELEVGILPGKESHEELLVAPANRGSISGHVWVENFTQPFRGLKVFLEPVRTPKQPVVITDKEGSFIFPDLLPGKYTIRIVGGIGYFTKPYNATIEVKAGEVADIEVVLKESIKRGLGRP